MIKVKITEELKKEAEKTQASTAPIEVARQLLAANVGQERAILEHLGMDHSIKEQSSKQAVTIMRSEEKEQMGQDVYTLDEIKELCQKFDMRFLPSYYYNGGVDSELAPTVRRFVEKNNINTEFKKDRFKIMAPSEAFNLEAYPVKAGVLPEPTLFYQTDNGLYAVIHHWGKDFTIFRRLRGFVNQTWGTWVFSRYCALVFMTAILLQLIGVGVTLTDNFILGAIASAFMMWLYLLVVCRKSNVIAMDFDKVRHLGLNVNWDSNKHITRRQ